MPDPVQIFEREFAEWLGVPDAVAAGFGRAALRLGLEAMHCKDKAVLVPSFICSQVVEAVRNVGATVASYPVQRDLTIRTADLLSALQPGVCAAIVPHYFGRATANIAELAAACRERNVLLIEDCALAWGASLRGKPAGTLGDISVFSCTKSDWCYGGGVLALRSSELAERARVVRAETFRAMPRLLLSYGLLRRADFLANRPRWSAVAERAGRRLEGLAGLGGGNFYDAGRCDAQMSSRGARRACHILRGIEADIRRRSELKRQLIHQLRDCPHVLFWSDEDPGDTGAFLLVHSLAGRAREWIEEAGRDRVTLRLSWPAYQDLPEGKCDALEWLAEHLTILEVHPKLTTRELQRIANCVRRLAARE